MNFLITLICALLVCTQVSMVDNTMPTKITQYEVGAINGDANKAPVKNQTYETRPNGPNNNIPSEYYFDGKDGSPIRDFGCNTMNTNQGTCGGTNDDYGDENEPERFEELREEEEETKEFDEFK